MSRKSKLQDEELLRKAINVSTAYNEILITMGLSPASGNYTKLHYYIKYYNIDVSHLQSNKNRCKGLKQHNRNKQFLLEDIIIHNKHPLYDTGKLKKRLIETNTLKNNCSICGMLPMWNNETLVLQLDHIDGIKTNHHISNLRLLCPNCHSQTNTFSGKNTQRKKGIQHKTAEEYFKQKDKEYIKTQDQYIAAVLNSTIDFTKYGWVSKLAIIIHQPPQKVSKWMKRFMSIFYDEHCFKRKG